MARYVISDNDSKSIKKSLKKWGTIPISTEYLDGVIKIENYRKYIRSEEIDVFFEGKIFVKISYEKRMWHSSDILKTHNISKVKLNRFLRRNLLFDVKTRMKYFGVKIDDYMNVKKIKWE